MKIRWDRLIVAGFAIAFFVGFLKSFNEANTKVEDRHPDMKEN